MSKPPTRGILVGGTRYGDPRTQAIHHCLDLLDLDLDSDASEPARIPLDFLAHGFAPHPSRAEAALLEKRGPGGAYVDLAARVVLGRIDPLPGHHFYGHGAFTRDAGALLAVETDLETRDGVISVRDPRSFAVIDTFPTFGQAPHDCALIEDGRTLVITNGGGPIGRDDDASMPCVAFVDVATQKLLDRHVVDDARINTGHVAVDRDRSFIVVSAPRDGLPDTALGGVSLRSKGGRLRHATEPAAVTSRMIGESLSVAIHAPSRTALCTHPYGHLITFWNLDTGALFGALDLPNARGVTLTLDQRYFAVSYGPAASLLLIETAPLRPVMDRDPGARRFSGSHVYAWG